MEKTRPCLRLPSPAEWREMVLPKEHGSWSLALEPLAFGLIAAPALVSALAAVAAGSAFVLAGHAGWVGPAALAVLAVRTFGLLVLPRPTLRARTLGMIEAGLGLAFVVGVALAWRA